MKTVLPIELVQYMCINESLLLYTSIFRYHNNNMPRTRLKPMTDKALCLRILVETLAIFITAIPLIYLYVVNSGDVEPVHR